MSLLTDIHPPDSFYQGLSRLIIGNYTSTPNTEPAPLQTEAEAPSTEQAADNPIAPDAEGESTPDRIPAAIVESVHNVEALPQACPTASAEDLTTASLGYPDQTVVEKRLEYALAEAEDKVTAIKGLLQVHPGGPHPLRAMELLLSLAELGKHGRHEDAIAAAQEAVNILKALHRRHPPAYEVILALALAELSTASCAGERMDEAIEAIRESVFILKALHRQLFMLGKADDALKPAQESLGMLRSWHQASPKVYDEHVVTRLQFNFELLAAAGRHQDALAASKECLVISKTLYQACPATHAATMATALLYRSIGLSNVGKHKEAIEAIERSLEMFENLDQTRLGAHKGSLAEAWRVYSTSLIAENRHTDALAAVEKSRELYRQLLAQSPTIFQEPSKKVEQLHGQVLGLVKCE
ncbi:hypothetical protein OC861_002044 [Tilletia horrida]|nr:hypothetical protein OC861_002044 [Tilletia horrida]